VIDFEWQKIKREMRGPVTSAEGLIAPPTAADDVKKAANGSSMTVAALSFAVALFSAVFTTYSWNTSQREAPRIVAVDTTLKLMTDQKLYELVQRGDEFLTGNGDAAHFSAALSLTWYYDYLAQPMNSDRIDPNYVSSELKCQLIGWDAAVLIFGEKLPPPVRGIAARTASHGKNAIEYNQQNQNRLPCPS
jgi:hypothetical protein